MTAQNIPELLRTDPGNPVFAEHADALREAGKPLEALQVCLSGLEANGSCHIGRLLLARIFFDLGHTSFAIRELEVLRQAVPSNVSLMRLVERLAPQASSPAPSVGTKPEVKAEAELTLDDLAALDEDE